MLSQQEDSKQFLGASWNFSSCSARKGAGEEERKPVILRLVTACAQNNKPEFFFPSESGHCTLLRREGKYMTLDNVWSSACSKDHFWNVVQCLLFIFFPKNYYKYIYNISNKGKCSFLMNSWIVFLYAQCTVLLFTMAHENAWFCLSIPHTPHPEAITISYWGCSCSWLPLWQIQTPELTSTSNTVQLWVVEFALANTNTKVWARHNASKFCTGESTGYASIWFWEGFPFISYLYVLCGALRFKNICTNPLLDQI